MLDLVKIKKGDVLTDSFLIAGKFKKPHDRVLRSIDKLKEEIGNLTRENVGVKNDVYIFRETKRKVRGREFRSYEMNRNSFSILAMGFTGKKALQWKMDFIKAFNSMEATLLNSLDSDWKQVRKDGKIARLEFTGCVSEFVKYAEDQGSKSSFRYYGNLTKMEYAALKMIEYKEKVPSDFRDTLDRMELFMLIMAEHVANETIKQGMEDKLHYKEIFILAKQAVLKYAESVLIKKLN